MKKLSLFLLGLVCALSLPSAAQLGGAGVSYNPNQVTGNLTVTASATTSTNYAVNISAPTTAGSSFGLKVLAGTNSSDFGMVVNNAANTLVLIQVRGDGAFFAPGGVNSSAVVVNGTTFTLGTGTGACATTSTLTGGTSAGSFLCTGTAGASTQIINLPVSTNGWSCWASDVTSGVVWAESTPIATTSAKISGTLTTTSDRVVFGCVGF